MTRTRLRPAHDPAVLALLYAVPHRHDRWPDHVARVQATVSLGRELIADTGPPEVIADLSCGDAAITRALAADADVTPRVILGDIAPGYEFCGPVEKTLLMVRDVDLFICTETIEHLDDPDGVLAAIRYRARALLLSTPLAEAGASNPQHYWAWDNHDVSSMLRSAGWAPVLYRKTHWEDGNGYVWAYQIWGCT